MLHNLLYYVYCPLGVAGRERVAAALVSPSSSADSTAAPPPSSAAALPPSGACASSAAAPPGGVVIGRVRVGLDGINASLTGPRALLEAHASLVSALPDVASAPAIDFKYAPVLDSRSAHDPSFPRASFTDVRVQRVAEIVTLRAPAATPGDPAHGGRHAAPADFHALLTAPSPPGSVLIDVRNAYESDVGTFEPAPSAGLAVFRPPVRRFDQMPAWVEEHAEALGAAPVIAMFCTGGIRCERFSAMVKERFPRADVVQLAGGIQRYMEAAEAGAGGGGGAAEPAASAAAPLPGGSRWRGRLFNFDERPPVRVVTDVLESESPHLPGILGSCVLCAASWDEYSWLRCAKCGVLVLACDACVAAGGGVEAVKPKLQCNLCATAPPPPPPKAKGAAKRGAAPPAASAAQAQTPPPP